MTEHVGLLRQRLYILPAICGTVIGDNELIIRQQLAPNTINLLFHKWHAVIGRHHYGIHLNFHPHFLKYLRSDWMWIRVIRAFL